jgi:hypothetical protein
MKNLKAGFTTLWKQNNSGMVYGVSWIVLLLGYFFFANFENSVAVFSFTSFGLVTRLKLFMSSLFDISQLSEIATLTLVICVTFIGALVVALMYTYIAMRGKMILRSGLYSGVGLVLAILGVGCAACGTVLLATVLSFFGFGGLLTYFPYHGIEVGYAGVVMLSYVVYTLIIRLANPYTC